MKEVHSYIQVPFRAECKVILSVNHISVLCKSLAVQTLVLQFFMATCGEEEMVAAISEESSKSAKSPAGTVGSVRPVAHSGSGYFELGRQTNLLQVEEHVHHTSDKSMAICLHSSTINYRFVADLPFIPFQCGFVPLRLRSTHCCSPLHICKAKFCSPC